MLPVGRGWRQGGSIPTAGAAPHRLADFVQVVPVPQTRTAPVIAAGLHANVWSAGACSRYTARDHAKTHSGGKPPHSIGASTQVSSPAVPLAALLGTVVSASGVAQNRHDR